MDKVLVIITTKRKPFKGVVEAVKRQDYKNISLLIHHLPPKKFSTDYFYNKRLNIIENRRRARIMALKTKANWFLWIDDDVILPKNAVSSFILQMKEKNSTIDVFNEKTGEYFPKGTPVLKKHIMGGWVPLSPDYWNCGKWVGNNLYVNMQWPHDGLVLVDNIDMACVMHSREILEQIEFKDGSNRRFKHGDGREMCSCECMEFVIEAQDLHDSLKGKVDYNAYMNGDVICKHLRFERWIKKWKSNQSRLQPKMSKSFTKTLSSGKKSKQKSN